MLRALSTAATGMNAQQMIVDTIANDLANMNTTGFKRTQVDFRDLMYVKLQEAGRDTTASVMAPSGFEIGSGVSPGSTMKVYSQGTLTNTAGQLDMAIQGDGFFQVTTPDGIRYTRDGSFRTNATGQLVTSTGYTMDPAITIPTDARSVSIGTDGTVTVFEQANTTGTVVGTINIVRFANPSGLSDEGNNLVASTPASGPAIAGTAGQNGMGSIQQGFLEQSNVDMITELVGLITAQRAYETNSRAIQAGDEMLQSTNRLGSS
jgi:flagellar basal-body rod protein FlgG